MRIKSIHHGNRTMVTWAILLGACVASGYLNCLLAYCLVTHQPPIGLAIPITATWTLTPPLWLAVRWWDVPLVGLMTTLMVVTTGWIRTRARQLDIVVEFGGMMVLETIITGTLCVWGVGVLTMGELITLITFGFGLVAGLEHGHDCIVDCFYAWLSAGIFSAFLPGLFLFGLLPGLVVALPLMTIQFVSAAIGIAIGLWVGTPFRAIDRWLHPIP